MSDENNDQVSTEKAAETSAASTVNQAAPAGASEAGQQQKTAQPVSRGKAMVILLYSLLLLSAVLSLVSYASSAVPDSIRQVVPVSFAVFYVIFVIYRAVLIRRRRYPMPKGVFQVGMGALFLVLLFNFSFQQKSASDSDTRPLKPLKELLRHEDPSVRALACDAFGTLSKADQAAAMDDLKKLLNDRNAAVRSHADKALKRSGEASAAQD